ncbi:hypothetical protein LCGC14_2307830 [marine sediment metagenome]|uniref:Uncharacterized protein n=1 Tax=marine sediment metagenome TaxID=412755 RepID=A0A0F9CM06_9ZZZZ
MAWLRNGRNTVTLPEGVAIADVDRVEIHVLRELEDGRTARNRVRRHDVLVKVSTEARVNDAGEEETVETREHQVDGCEVEGFSITFPEIPGGWPAIDIAGDGGHSAVQWERVEVVATAGEAEHVLLEAAIE